MFGSNFQRHLLVAFASLLMSTVAVGAAIGPVQFTSPTVSANA